MANPLSPTAANIISSLGIKGATIGATVDECKPGFIPVLDENGKLSANLIPEGAAQAAIPPLSKVAFVDPGTEVEENLRKGSVVAPYISIEEAAEKFVPEDGVVAIVLSPGEYSDTEADFRPGTHAVYFEGLGNCVLKNSIQITGLTPPSGGRAAIAIHNVTIGGQVSVVCSSVSVICTGQTFVGTLYVSGSAELRLSAESRVDSTSIEKIYLSDAYNVGNVPAFGESSPAVPGATVGDALKRLGTRKIRVAHMTVGSSGIDVGSSYDISADSAGGVEVYDLSERDRVLANGINRLFRLGDHIHSITVDANTVTADLVKAGRLEMDALTLGGYNVTVDTYGYLVVEDFEEGDSSSSYAPPDRVVIIRDSVTGDLYVLGVANGRLYIVLADEDASTAEVVDSLDVPDEDQGYDYSVSISRGRLLITRIPTQI